MKEMEAKTENRYEYRKPQEKRKQMRVNIIPLGSHQFPASEPPGNGIFHLQSHHNILWQHTYLISL